MIFPFFKQCNPLRISLQNFEIDKKNLQVLNLKQSYFSQLNLIQFFFQTFEYDCNFFFNIDISKIFFMQKFEIGSIKVFIVEFDPKKIFKHLNMIVIFFFNFGISKILFIQNFEIVSIYFVKLTYLFIHFLKTFIYHKFFK